MTNVPGAEAAPNSSAPPPAPSSSQGNASLIETLGLDSETLRRMQLLTQIQLEPYIDSDDDDVSVSDEIDTDVTDFSKNEIISELERIIPTLLEQVPRPREFLQLVRWQRVFMVHFCCAKPQQFPHLPQMMAGYISHVEEQPEETNQPSSSGNIDSAPLNEQERAARSEAVLLFSLHAMQEEVCFVKFTVNRYEAKVQKMFPKLSELFQQNPDFLQHDPLNTQLLLELLEMPKLVRLMQQNPDMFHQIVRREYQRKCEQRETSQSSSLGNNALGPPDDSTSLQTNDTVSHQSSSSSISRAAGLGMTSAETNANKDTGNGTKHADKALKTPVTAQVTPTRSRDCSPKTKRPKYSPKLFSSAYKTHHY